MHRVCLCILACATTLPAVPSFQLPNDVIPKKHIIELTIDPTLDTFTGWARIEVELSRSTNILWVNAKDLAPLEASVSWQGRMVSATASSSAAVNFGNSLIIWAALTVSI